MSTTARKIITKAMLKVGILVKNEVPDPDEANDALEDLNAMIDSWSNDSLAIYARTWETFTLTGGQLKYTIGTGGDLNTIRPSQIIDSYLRISTIDYPISIVDDGVYNSISFKSLTGIPEFLNFDNAYPLANIRLYPVPSSNYQLFLLTEKPITEFTTLDTVMVLPAGWERALIYNLAMEIAPEYNQEIPAAVVDIAKKSLGNVRTSTARVHKMDAYPSGVVVRNIFSGWRF